MYNKKLLSKIDLGKFTKSDPYKKDIIYDPMGQWKYPGQNTRIPSNNITMKGLNKPLLGVASTGEKKMMQPGQEYNFPGADYVDEFPQAKEGMIVDLSPAEIEEYRKGGYIIEELDAYDNGGDLPPKVGLSYLPKGERSYYDPIMDNINLDSNASEGELNHEMAHAWQNRQDGFRSDPYSPKLRPSAAASDEQAATYFNRKGDDVDRYLNNLNTIVPELGGHTWNKDIDTFIPDQIKYDKVIDPLMYSDPTTLEGEAEYMAQVYGRPPLEIRKYGGLHKFAGGGPTDCGEGMVWSDELQDCVREQAIHSVTINQYTPYINAWEEMHPVQREVEQKKAEYLRKAKGLNKTFGVNADNFPQNVLDNIYKTIDRERNNYVITQYAKDKGFNPNKHVDLVENIAEKGRFGYDMAQNSKYGSKLAPSLWARSLAGAQELGNFVVKQLPGEQGDVFKYKVPGLSKKERKEIANSKYGALETASILNLPGQIIANQVAKYVKPIFGGTGADARDQEDTPGVLSGQYIPGVDDDLATVLNPFTWTGLTSGLMGLPSAVNALKLFTKAKVIDDVAPLLTKVDDVTSLNKVDDVLSLQTTNNKVSEINWGNWNKEILENKPLMQEYTAIEEASKANGTWMKNPDGSPFVGSKLTKEEIIAHPKLSNDITNEEIAKMQFVQQQSSHFKKAFGDSKLINPDGSPWILQHGSPKKFDTFDESKFQLGDSGYSGSGIYTVPPKGSADSYTISGRRFHTGDIEPTLYRLYGQGNNPITSEELIKLGVNSPAGKEMDLFHFHRKSAPLNEQLLDYDVAIHNQSRGIERIKDLDDAWEVVFPTNKQLKSAIGNNGMFDLTNPNIYKALIPAIGLGAASQMPQNKYGGALNKFIGGGQPCPEGYEWVEAIGDCFEINPDANDILYPQTKTPVSAEYASENPNVMPYVLNLPEAQAGLPDWMADNKKFGKDNINWYQAWNPKKWGLNDYSEYSSYNSAFRNARASKEKEFVYKGERYNTDLIPKKESDLYWESKNFLKDYYKNEPYKFNGEFDSYTPREYLIKESYIKDKYGISSVELYDKIETTDPNDPKYIEMNELSDKIMNEELDIENKTNKDYANYQNSILTKAKQKAIDGRLGSLDKPSYFSITNQKPKSMRADGYWNEKDNKTFMYTESMPGKLNTTYVHELSHKGDDFLDVLNTVPQIDMEKFNKNPYIKTWDQKHFDYVSNPTEIEARKLSTLFYLFKNKKPYKSGKITQEILDDLYSNSEKLP